MTTTRSLPILMFLLAFIAPATWAQEKMEINWTQPVSVGDRFRINAEAADEETTTRTFGGRREAPNTSRLQMRFIATAEVRRVDDEKLATEVAYQIEEFVVAREDQAVRPISSGQTLVATRVEQGQTEYEVDGEPVNPRTREVLEILLEMPSGDPEDAAFFGAEGAMAAGAQWPVNADAVVASLQEKGAQVDAQNVSGNVKLIGGTEHKSIATAHVRAALQVQDVTPPEGAVPSGFSVKELSIRNIIDAHLPLDEANPIPLARASGERTMRLEGRSGEQLILVVLEITRRSEVKREVARITAEE